MSDADIKRKALSDELADAIDRETQAAYAQGAEAVWAMLGCGADPRFPNVAIAISRDLPEGDGAAYLPQYVIIAKAALSQGGNVVNGYAGQLPNPMPAQPAGGT